jgi:hypothetical protein
MAALAREALFTACRNIYDMAGENYVFPPLIRDVRLKAQSSYTYNFLVEGGDLFFNVELDEACADRNALPFSKLPLRFEIRLYGPGRPDLALELDESEKKALIRAFLLGAKAPIVVEPGSQGEAYKISLQLSSTYFVYCGELIDDVEDATGWQICVKVARELYKISREFFGSQEEGTAVWSLRVAQDLFGEPMPPPEAFWPPVRQTFGPCLGQELGQEIATIRPQRDLVLVEKAAPRNPRYAAMAASLVVALAGAAMSVQFGVGPSRPPETAASRADDNSAASKPEMASERLPVRYASVLDDPPVLSSAALVVHYEQHFGESEAQEDTTSYSSFTSRKTPQPEGSLQGEAADSDSSVPLSHDDQDLKLEAARHLVVAAGPDNRIKGQGNARKIKAHVASKPARGGSNNGRQPQPDNPLALVGRTVDGITQQVVKDLKRIRYQFSSLTQR